MHLQMAISTYKNTDFGMLALPVSSSVRLYFNVFNNYCVCVCVFGTYLLISSILDDLTLSILRFFTFGIVDAV